MAARPPRRRAPKHLDPPTRRWWVQVARDYELEAHHLRLLTLACEAWDRGLKAREVLAVEGLTFEDRFDQPKARPEVAIARDAAIMFARLIRELALDVEPPPSRLPRVGGQK